MCGKLASVNVHIVFCLAASDVFLLAFLSLTPEVRSVLGEKLQHVIIFPHLLISLVAAI